MRSPARCQKKTSSSPPREREKDRSKKPCKKLTSKKREEKSLLNFREPRLTPLTRTFSSPRKQKKDLGTNIGKAIKSKPKSLTMKKREKSLGKVDQENFAKTSKL
jgi:hypothetical protein